ncbi:hypothetical protein V499_09266 [Pseudogymnoascus sp. VKM F-103]|uniref:Uncharacterized protein n=1 Tax=Pseudogymnoascus verrucosus TaxID=342668 RepID=A0A2P2SW07_9PEZI|nr:uncharacterized protein VE01_00931 [Pseudogymnoascus verrucosus]KFY70319.1 hypothetical protein V499_09266 [Pseudogymnoascus sp. VKM F-103]OBU01019.1 hypothetical protein VE01_00931 [Pseudogymnoascus verrucosus]
MTEQPTPTAANGLPTPPSDTVAFPTITPLTTTRPDSGPESASGSRQSTANSNADGVSPGGHTTIANRLRSASRTFEQSSIPVGMWSATASIASSAPSIADIRRGSFGSDGWSGDGQLKEKSRRASLGRRTTSNSAATKNGTGSGLTEVAENKKLESPIEDVSTSRQLDTISAEGSADSQKPVAQQNSASVPLVGGSTTEPNEEYRTEPFDNGYEFPPKHSWQTSTAIGAKALWKFFITPLGFLVVIYGLNVVAWGGMLFLLLCNASPAMCSPTCDDINSPRRIWIEIDSQILNALFCVTGFGLVPWRFRDLYYLMKYHIRGDQLALRRLAGIHRDWFRLEGSSDLPISVGPDNIEAEISNLPENAVPYPLKTIPSAPLTGNRAPATARWKMDFFIWMFVWNTFLQIVLSVFMWKFNRYERPSWSTGLFVAMACIVAGIGGIMGFLEGKKVKSIEGVEVSPEDQARLRRDREMGIVHYNNLKGEKPKPKKEHHNPLTHRSLKGEKGEKVDDLAKGITTETSTASDKPSA